MFESAVLIYGSLNAILALSYALIKKGSIDTPHHFSLYSIFVLIVIAHTYFFRGAYLFFWLFLSGGLYWLMIYNFRDLYAKRLTFILILLGLLMSAAYVYSLISPITTPNLVSLFAAPTDFLKHSNLGDLWAVILVGTAYLAIKSKTKLLIPIFVLGTYFLIISYSRTALVSFAVGFFYIISQQGLRWKKTIISALIILLSALFLYMGLSKTTIFDRPYFMEAVQGLIKYPFGTGLGNFDKVSTLTNYVHDLPLEIVSGMGIFSIIFIVWILGIIKRIFLNKKQINVEAAGMFLAIFISFLFDTTYTIPGMIWVWFAALALGNSSNLENR